MIYVAACCLLKQGENGSIKHTEENQKGPRQRKATKGRRGSISKLQRLLAHVVVCTAEKNSTLVKNLKSLLINHLLV